MRAGKPRLAALTQAANSVHRRAILVYLSPNGLTFFWRNFLLTTAEQRVLSTFRKFLVDPGQMLCFHGPNLDQHAAALKQLTDKDLLIREQFKGGYSLTTAGYAAMNDCE